MNAAINFEFTASGPVTCQHHVYLDPQSGGVWIDWNYTHERDSMPESVFSGRVLRAPVPWGVKLDALLNVITDEIRDLIFAGYEAYHDGSNFRGRYTDEANAAWEQLSQEIEEIEPDYQFFDAGSYYDMARGQLIQEYRDHRDSARLRDTMEPESDHIVPDWSEYVEEIIEMAEAM